MSIATLAGVIDAGVYVIGYFPTGVDVGADFTQIINKLNEVTDGAEGLNTANLDIATNNSALITQAILIQANYDDIAAYEVSNDAAVGALDTRVGVVEGAVGSAVLTVSGSVVLSVAQVTQSRIVNVQDAGGGGTPTIGLPETGSLPAAPPVLTIINNGFTGVNVQIDGADSGSWADGTAGSNEMVLANGESLTVYPFDDDGGSTFEWGILAGKAYSDLTPA